MTAQCHAAVSCVRCASARCLARKSSGGVRTRPCSSTSIRVRPTARLDSRRGLQPQPATAHGAALMLIWTAESGLAGMVAQAASFRGHGATAWPVATLERLVLARTSSGGVPSVLGAGSSCPTLPGLWALAQACATAAAALAAVCACSAPCCQHKSRRLPGIPHCSTSLLLCHALTPSVSRTWPAEPRPIPCVSVQATVLCGC